MSFFFKIIYNFTSLTKIKKEFNLLINNKKIKLALSFYIISFVKIFVSILNN